MDTIRKLKFAVTNLLICGGVNAIDSTVAIARWLPQAKLAMILSQNYFHLQKKCWAQSNNYSTWVIGFPSFELAVPDHNI